MGCYRYADPGLDACAFEDDRQADEDRAAHFMQLATEDTDRLREIFAEEYEAGNFDWIQEWALARVAGNQVKQAECLIQLASIVDQLVQDEADRLERNW